MNLLMVTAGLPRPVGGANTRNFHLLKALSKTHRVSLLVLANSNEMNELNVIFSLKELAESVQLISYELPDRFKRPIQLLNAARGKSYFLNLFIVPEMQHALDTMCSLTHFEVALFESVLTAGYQLPERTMIAIDQHNIEHELLERTYKHEKALIRKWYSWRESRLLKQGEMERCKKADMVLVTSEREHDVLCQLLPEQQIEVIPNGVDIDTFVPGNSSREVPHQIIFTGTMDYFPNIDAVLFFARKCWPLIQDQVPGVTWQIVGKNPPPEIKELAKLPGITVTGTVPEVHSYLATSSVVIAPLQVGSGTRLKILEAFAMKRAVVSTSIGCEGLAVEDGKHLIVADRPEQFALAVITLLNNRKMRDALGKAGRELVETKYSWTHCGTQLLQALEIQTREGEQVC
ncbi:MAG TPA: glycosyltransferase [Ktedonobacteraceae bacterium]|nr:glycosyltransferase [Ktedonobacteraceae bacterium]